MKASVPGGAHMIKFFEGMCKMLPAVVSGRKGNIRNVQSTVAQKKGGLFHTLAVDIGIDGAAVFFCKERLQVGFVDPCICGDGRNINVFQIMLVNIAERFFQHLVCGLPVGIFCCPGVRVVAELAAHVAALHKNHVAYARSVDGTEALDRMDRALYRAIVVLIHFTHVFSSSFQLTIFAFICIFRYFSISWMPGKFLPFFRVLLDYTEIRGSFQGISMYKIEHIFLCIFFFYYIAL